MRRLPARSHLPSKLHRNGWRTRNISLVLLVLVGLVSIFVFFFGLQLSRSPFLSPYRTTFILPTQPVTIISFAKKEIDENFVITLPESAYTRVPFGYGPYRLGAVAKLGELEKKPGLLADTISDVLAVPLTGWISTTELTTLTQTNESSLSQLKKTFNLLFFLRKNFTTNLDMIDRWILAWKLLGMHGTNTRFFNTSESASLFGDLKLADGTVVKQVNEDLLSSYLEQKFEYSEIRADSLSVKIINATNIAGIAQKFARFVSASGGKILILDTQKELVPRCLVKTKSEHRSKKLTEYIKDELGCEVVIVNTDLSADLEVLVGTYFGERWK